MEASYMRMESDKGRLVTSGRGGCLLAVGLPTDNGQHQMNLPLLVQLFLWNLLASAQRHAPHWADGFCWHAYCIML